MSIMPQVKHLICPLRADSQGVLKESGNNQESGYDWCVWSDLRNKWWIINKIKLVSELIKLVQVDVYSFIFSLQKGRLLVLCWWIWWRLSWNGSKIHLAVVSPVVGHLLIFDCIPKYILIGLFIEENQLNQSSTMCVDYPSKKKKNQKKLK